MFDGITILSATPHTHLLGVEVFTKVIRNGTDIGYLTRNKEYDFNYQQSIQVDPPFTLTKVCYVINFISI
jgi:hypothetical protein